MLTKKKKKIYLFRSKYPNKESTQTIKPGVGWGGGEEGQNYQNLKIKFLWSEFVTQESYP